MSELSTCWKLETDRDPRHRIGITLDRPLPLADFLWQPMSDPNSAPTVKRRRGRPATKKVAVRDLRVTLSAEQDARYLAYRAHVEAQAPGFIPTDAALARAVFLLGLEAFVSVR